MTRAEWEKLIDEAIKQYEMAKQIVDTGIKSMKSANDILRTLIETKDEELEK